MQFFATTVYVDAPRAKKDDLKKIAPYLWGRFKEHVLPKLSQEADFLVNNDEPNVMFPNVKLTSSDVADCAETAYPVQETGKNYSEADNKKLFGENKFTTMGNPSDFNVDMREVEVDTGQKALYKKSDFQDINPDFTVSNNQKSSVQATEDPQVSRSSSTVSVYDTEVSEIMSSQLWAEVTISDTTSRTPSPIMSDGEEKFVNSEIADEMKMIYISSPDV